MKRALVFLIALLVTPALPGVAGAHVEVTPSTAPAGKAVELALSVGHGCDEAATNRLEVLMPAGAAYYAPGKVAGWKSSTPKGKIVWTGGPLPSNEVLEFPFNAKLYGEKGSSLTFKVIQGCEGGAETAWIQPTPADGTEPESPASVLTLTSTAQKPAVETDAETAAAVAEAKETGDDLTVASAGDSDQSEDDEGVSWLPIIGAILIVASVTAFIVIQRGKRK